MLEVKILGKSFDLPKKRGKKEQVGPRDPRDDGKYFHAVRDVSFTCEGGQVLGLLGANGAGKTTTLRMLATAIKPTSGTAVMDGIDICQFPEKAKKRIGFLSSNTGLYGRLTAREMVEYFGQLHGIEKDELEERMNVLFRTLGMEDYLDKRNDSLSTGMKQKVSIARTLIHDPQVIFFDEPTAGLDIMSSRAIIDFIYRCKEEKKTVVFSTHIMHEVDKLCDKLCVIHQGKSYFQGSVDEVKNLTGMDDLDDAFVALVSKESPQ